MSKSFNYLPIDRVSIGEQSIEGVISLIGRDRLKDSVITTSNSVSQNAFFKKAADELSTITAVSSVLSFPIDLSIEPG